MRRRPFGATGLDVSVVGFGAGHIGDPAYDDRTAARLLHAEPGEVPSGRL